MRHCMYIVMLLMYGCQAVAEDVVVAAGYGSNLLHEMAAAMHLEARLHSLTDGVHWRELDYHGHHLTVIKTEGCIEHLGYALFTSSQRALSGETAVFNFIERYLLECDLPLARPMNLATKMKIDHVDIQCSLSSLVCTLQADTTYAFSVENNSGRKMSMHWSKGGETLCKVTFPIDYELLSGMEIQEREQRLIADLRRSTKTVPDLLPTSTEGMEQSQATGIYLLSGETYYSDDMSANHYYRMDEQGRLRLLCDPRHPLESIANLMTSTSLAGQTKVSLALDIYALRQDHLTVPLTGLNTYMLRHGCKVFFGVMDFNGQKATCMLVYKNDEQGYHHVMKAEADVGLIERTDGTIEARLTPYIPSSNVLYLFDELKK